MTDISQLSKGAVPQPDDPRDFQAGFVLGAPVIDWQKGFRLPEPPDSDQGQALRCVGEGSSYFHWQLTRKRYSPKDIYAQIFLPQGGAYLREGPRIICTKGQQTLDECPDPQPNTEAANRIRCANPEKALDDVEAGYYSVNAKSPDAMAQAIMEGGGVLFGVQGSNPGWHNLLEPRPPIFGEQTWGHAIYAFGFHLHDGQKCVIAKSSWCNSGVKEHHIKQNYFDSWNTFDGWTLIPKEKLKMYRRFLVHDEASGRLGVCVVNDTGFADAVIWAKNEAHLVQLKVQYEVPASAPTVTFPRVNPS